MFQVKCHEADMDYICRSIMSEEASFKDTSPYLIKVYYPSVAAEYFHVKYRHLAYVQVLFLDDVENQNSKEKVKQICGEGYQPVQVFRKVTTTFYAWDGKETFYKSSEKVITTEWLQTIKGTISKSKWDHNKAEIEANMFDLCNLTLETCKRQPSLVKQKNSLLVLITCLYYNLQGTKHEKDINCLTLYAYDLVVECGIDDVPDVETPREVYTACLVSLDTDRTIFIKTLERCNDELGITIYFQILRELGATMWQLNKYRSPFEENLAMTISMALGNYNVYKDVISMVLKRKNSDI